MSLQRDHLRYEANGVNRNGNGESNGVNHKGNGGPNGVSRKGNGQNLIYIDGRALTRDCVANQLAMQLPEFSVAAFASADEIGAHPEFDGQECSILYNTYSLPVEDPEFLHSLSVMQRIAPEARITLLSDLESGENIAAALRLGVRGYLLTSLSLKITSEVIRLVHAGGTFVPASALLAASWPTLPERTPANPTPELQGFTRREVEVLNLLRQGKQNKTIAFDLNMSESTVKIHLHHIMKKLQATNRMQVVLWTQELFEDHQPAETQEVSTAYVAE
jgi:DNA-binding NarL/FixJ family response regulator